MTMQQQVPAGVVSLSDYQALAQTRMSEQAWAYVSGGAADELTLQDNQAAFRRLRLRSRVLRDLGGGNTRLRLLGQDFDFPILLAPVAYQKLAHAQGELATVMAASALQAGMLVSTQASVSLEEIAANASCPLWFQLYLQPDRAFTEKLVRRAEAAGYRALVLTVDAPVNGVRNREQRAGFSLPAEVQAVNLQGQYLPSVQPAAAGGALLLGGSLLAAAPTWGDVAWLRSITQLPLLLKGVTCVEDAAEALQHGVDGLVVSNHGGRTLDTLAASLDCLEPIADALGGRLPLLFDGGIRRGSDILKALALGADAVLIGRPYVYGLAVAGAVGVAHVVQVLRAELEIAMALTGCPDLAAIGKQVLMP
jgi:4-hydroxymandelate oxidase